MFSLVLVGNLITDLVLVTIARFRWLWVLPQNVLHQEIPEEIMSLKSVHGTCYKEPQWEQSRGGKLPEGLYDLGNNNDLGRTSNNCSGRCRQEKG